MDAFLEDREMGLLTSYTILEALLGFETSSGSDSERKFEEVKAVYAGLERSLSSCQEDGYHDRLAELTTTVDPLIQGFSETPSESVEGLGDSKLLDGTLARLSTNFRRSYADRLKRDGLALYQRMKREGVQRRKVDALNSDYRQIEDVFVKGIR